VSPALNEGCCLPVANASSAILIKSIVVLLLNCFIVTTQHTRQHSPDSDCAKALQSNDFFGRLQTCLAFLFTEMAVFLLVSLYLWHPNYKNLLLDLYI
jgi:hypothetical protein